MLRILRESKPVLWGGFIEKESNLYGNAKVYGNAEVCGDKIKNRNDICYISNRYYKITITPLHIKIGCQYHAQKAWWNFTNEQIEKMDGQNALEFWKIWKEPLKQICIAMKKEKKMLNKVEIIGRACKEPEVRHTQTAVKVVNLTVAVSESWKDAQGEKQERTEWIPIVVFTKSDYIEKYCHKGDLVYICGKMQIRNYEKDGRKVYVTEVVLSGINSKFEILKSANPKTDKEPEQLQDSYDDDLNDEIPFN